MFFGDNDCGGGVLHYVIFVRAMHAPYRASWGLLTRWPPKQNHVSSYQVAEHATVSAACMLKAAAVPMTKRCTPSAPTTLAAPPHVALVVPSACWHTSSGATSRSTFCRLPGAAAGHTCSRSDAGTARASAAEQVSAAGGG